MVEKYQGLILNNRADQSNLNLAELSFYHQGSPHSFTFTEHQDAMAMIIDLLWLSLAILNGMRLLRIYLKVNCHCIILIRRVFKMKLNHLFADITERQVLGVVVAKVHVIEFQKHGLPHCHLLIHLRYEDKLWHRNDIDKLILAEIPDPISQPDLYAIVKTCMIHGSYGHLRSVSVCMDNGECTKNYPKIIVQRQMNQLMDIQVGITE